MGVLFYGIHFCNLIVLLADSVTLRSHCADVQTDSEPHIMCRKCPFSRDTSKSYILFFAAGALPGAWTDTYRCPETTRTCAVLPHRLPSQRCNAHAQCTLSAFARLSIEWQKMRLFTCLFHGDCWTNLKCVYVL